MSRRRDERLPRRRGHADLDAAREGRNTDSDDVARLLEAARAPGTQEELAGLAAARAAFAAAADDVGDSEPDPMPARGRRVVSCRR